MTDQPTTPAQVAVKPLEWVEDTESACTRAFAPALGGKMIVVEIDPGSGEYSAGIDLSGLCFRLIQADYKDEWGIPYSAPAKFDSLDDAKAAAQADYEARIRSALISAPAPAEQDLVAWNGPGEKPHEYSPDYMAMGDCRICGHTRDAHYPAPVPAVPDSPSFYRPRPSRRCQQRGG